jgi:hypothetical protein
MVADYVPPDKLMAEIRRAPDRGTDREEGWVNQVRGRDAGVTGEFSSLSKPIPSMCFELISSL